MNRYVIIVAGGKGLRMGGEIPKQFIDICGKPILMRTIEAFYSFDSSIKIVLVLPKVQQEFWDGLCKKYNFNIPYSLTEGGETRFQSVKNGLALVNDDGIVGVHDGVRPFVSNEVLINCYNTALKSKAVVPVIDVVETVRCVTGDNSITVPRDNYKLVQTPQVFKSNLLKIAYSQEYNSSFTDDASVVESLGEKIELVQGNRENIKITTPYDLKLAEFLCHR